MEIEYGIGVDNVKFGMDESEVIDILGKDYTKDIVEYDETHNAFILEYNNLELYFYFDSKDNFKLTGFSSHSIEHTLSGLTLIGLSKKEVISGLLRRGINDLVIEDWTDLEDSIDMNYMPDEILNSDKSGLSLWFIGDKLTKIQSAEIKKETEKISNHFKNNEVTFLKKHKGNIIFFAILAIIFFTPIGFQLKVLVNRYIHFAPSEIAKEEQISLANYNWNLTDDKGNAVDFNDYRGKVIIVNFWATWCPPCVAELPSFQELYDSYNNDVVFLFVANDKKEKVAAFMKKYNYQFTNYYEVSATPTELQSSSIPATFVISKEGNIVMSKTGATDWNSEKVKGILDRLIL